MRVEALLSPNWYLTFRDQDLSQRPVEPTVATVATVAVDSEMQTDSATWRKDVEGCWR